MIELVIFVVVLMGLFLVVFTRKRNTSEDLSEPSHPYEALVLDECDFSCSESFKLSGRAFLKHEAPELPLPECDKKPSCKCRLIPHKDRRQGKEDRRRLSRVLQDTFIGKNHRKDGTRGRRRDD